VPNLELSFAIGDYDRNRPLIDGRIGVDGVDPIFMTLSPEEIFFRAFRHQAFDVCELSFGSYVVGVDRGDAHYIAVPAFLSRAFRHTSILVRTDRGIEKPLDLKGRRIGIAEYQLSANVWARGLLEDEYGVKPSDIRWVRGGMEQPGRPEKITLELPSEVSIENAPANRSLNSMLEAGEIDGFIGPRTLSCFDRGHPDVGRLFNDSVAVASEYYRRTGVFPIMHLLGVRRRLADRHPWLPNALFKAFAASKKLALDELADTSATKVTLPFVEEQLVRARDLLGTDFWSYGVPPNRGTLETFLDYHHRQGLSSRRIGVEELFHPSTLESFSI
jgi:4,5-dihydroxyphthalate decarboxylase